MISLLQRAEIRRLFYAEHWPVGTIADALGVHHETVQSRPQPRPRDPSRAADPAQRTFGSRGSMVPGTQRAR